jgi:hypothetical protein
MIMVVLLVWLSCLCGCPARVVVLLTWLSNAVWSSLLLHGNGLPRPHCHMVFFFFFEPIYILEYKPATRTGL